MIFKDSHELIKIFSARPESFDTSFVLSMSRDEQAQDRLVEGSIVF